MNDRYKYFRFAYNYDDNYLEIGDTKWGYYAKALCDAQMGSSMTELWWENIYE